MYKPLTEKELQFMENFYNPVVLMQATTPEVSIEDWDNLEKPCIRVRNYQLPFVAYDVCIAEDKRKSWEANFKLRESAGTLLIISGRGIGKTFLGLVRNILVKIVTYAGKEMAISCYDSLHVKKVAEEVCDYLDSHLFFKQYRKSIVRSPIYSIKTKNGNLISSVNENIAGRLIGQQWWSKHVSFNFQDEYQSSTKEANEKKIDAIHEKGCVEVLCGIPLVSEGTPLSDCLKDRRLKKRTVRIPQFVSPYWSETKKQDKIIQYGGQESAGYLVNVAAETVEGAFGAFNMAKIRSNCFREDKYIKSFEINEKNFVDKESLVVLLPIKGSLKTLVTADIGYSAATEILVFGFLKDKYRIVANVTAYNLDDKELYQLISMISNKVQATHISCDCTIMGAPVYRQLVEEFGKEKVYWVSFNEKIVIGFEKDNEGKIVFDKNGNPVVREENTLIASVQNLKDLFYEALIEVPADFYKLDDQLSCYLQLVHGNKVTFDSNGQDHLVQAMQVFSVVDLLTKTESASPNQNNRKLSLGVF